VIDALTFRLEEGVGGKSDRADSLSKVDSRFGGRGRSKLLESVDVDLGRWTTSSRLKERDAGSFHGLSGKRLVGGIVRGWEGWSVDIGERVVVCREGSRAFVVKVVMLLKLLSGPGARVAGILKGRGISVLLEKVVVVVLGSRVLVELLLRDRMAEEGGGSAELGRPLGRVARVVRGVVRVEADRVGDTTLSSGEER
jgi:hypothetical protein